MEDFKGEVLRVKKDNIAIKGKGVFVDLKIIINKDIITDDEFINNLEYFFSIIKEIKNDR